MPLQGKLDDCSFGITGLKLQGAKCLNNKLSVAATIFTELPLTKLQWVRVNVADIGKMSHGKVGVVVCMCVLLCYSR